MFELKILESEESEDTLRASQARVARWVVRVGSWLGIWLMLGVPHAHASPRRDVAEGRSVRPWACGGSHLWCDSHTGRCGVHGPQHR